MAYDQSGGGNPPQKERKAGERAGRKRLDEKDHPQPALTPEEQDAANRTRMRVTAKPNPNPLEIKRAVGEE